jgi:hypothetical protein
MNRIGIPFLYAQGVTHVLLFDEGTPQQIQELGNNSRLVSDCFRRLLSDAGEKLDERQMALKFGVVFAVQEASRLAVPCEKTAAGLRAAGVSACVADVKGISALRGKIGLLSGLLEWTAPADFCIGGTVLLNDVPITEKQAEMLLFQASRLDSPLFDRDPRHYAHRLVLLKQGWFHLDHRMGLLRSSAIKFRLLRDVLDHPFPDHHSVSDILKAMGANCSGDQLLVVRCR